MVLWVFRRKISCGVEQFDPVVVVLEPYPFALVSPFSRLHCVRSRMVCCEITMKDDVENNPKHRCALAVSRTVRRFSGRRTATTLKGEGSGWDVAGHRLVTPSYLATSK